jgi:glycosyltransferase involved in cell wall biosynthesis
MTTSPHALRVAVLTVDWWPLGGGAERQMYQALRATQPLGHFDIHIFTKALSGQPARESYANCTVHRLRAVHGTTRFSSASFAVGAFWRTLWLRPDIIVGSMVQSATFTAYFCSLLIKKPLVVRLAGGGLTSEGLVETEVDTVLRTRKRSVVRALFRSSRTTVIAPAQHLLDDPALEDLVPASRRRLIPNGIELRRSDDASFPPTDVVWYGRNDPAKNPQALLRVVEELPGRTFTTIGRIELPPRPNLTHLGWVATPEDVIASARVVLMTSLIEGRPNFALQGLAFGKWVVGLENTALRELREEFPNSVYLAPNDEGLAVLLEQTLARTDSPPPVHVPTTQDAAVEWVSLFRQVRTRSEGAHQ